MFRRRTDTATEEPPQPVEPPKAEGKGRPTPKRREAEKRNRQPITAPRTRKEAYRQARERQATDRKKSREGVARGDQRHMLKRDKGPVRQLARDFVDSRRTFGEFFMYLTILIVVASMVAPLAVRVYLQTFGLPVMLVVIIGESVWIANRVKKMSHERFPDESTQGVGIYAATRSMQIRRLRMPQARLKPGQKAEV
ncbi:DUF3043 domain-containing protein [Actinomadura sp. DC4]|uniref:DUF3043 domain-containing protein n=1 Tax=Actinomadura sp. DC4 TaxID=3055069 RepID=UPI0025AF4A3D|nr:DUF3043 domain-containing protein [Actinomadura sp. DC4]MDN3353241.1 DUF3043 domain-containing protein [Actinomadura sp. DC4]